MLNHLLKLRNSRKGFTLIEIIVVLVILAILAAVAIPSMLGYVNQAKGAQYITEARLFYTAGQVVATKYQLGTKGTDITLQGTKSVNATGDDYQKAATDISSMVNKDVNIGILPDDADFDKSANSYNYQLIIKDGKVTNTQVIAKIGKNKWIKVDLDLNNEAVFTEYSGSTAPDFGSKSGDLYVNGEKTS